MPGVELDRWGYDCMSVDPCDIDDDLMECQTFWPLHRAGVTFIHISVVNYILLLQWMMFVINVICFNRHTVHPILVYAFPHLAWFMHLLAIICWAAISEVDYDSGDCVNDDFDPDEQLDICIREGPVLIIVQLFLQIGAAAHFTLIYFRRGDDTATPQHA